MDKLFLRSRAKPTPRFPDGHVNLGSDATHKGYWEVRPGLGRVSRCRCSLPTVGQGGLRLPERDVLEGFPAGGLQGRARPRLLECTGL